MNRCLNCNNFIIGHANRKYCGYGCKMQATKFSRINAKKSWEKKAIGMGLCISCAKPAKTKLLCEDHAKKSISFSQKWNLKNKRRVKSNDRIRNAKKNYINLWKHQILLLEIGDEIRRKSLC